MTKQPDSWSLRKLSRLSAMVGRVLICRSRWLVVVARHRFLRYALILHRRLQDHAAAELIDHGALDFLPRRLALGIAIATIVLQRRAALVQLRRRHQHIDGVLVEIDAHAVAGLE